MARTFLAVSHKGGTGRSVTIANVGYQLAMGGSNVCMVDLDLGSSTLGAVWNVEYTEQRGVEGGIGRLLIEPDPTESEILGSLVNLWSASEFFKQARGGGGAKLQLLPGTRDLGDMGNEEVLREPLHKILTVLAENYDYVFADVRSGISAVTLALATGGVFRHLVTGWLVFHRWTPQHLIGANDMVTRLSGWNWSDRTYLIRTAYVNPQTSLENKEKNRDWFMNQETRLLKERKKFSNRTLATIDFSRILQWEERVLTDSFARDANFYPCEEIAQFKDLADKLRELPSA